MSDVPEFFKDAVDRFIRDYRPALNALAHGDLGHTIRWPEPDKAECSCGEKWEVERV